MIKFWEPVSGASDQFDYYFRRVSKETDSNTYLIQCTDAQEILRQNLNLSNEKNFIFYYTEELLDTDNETIWNSIKQIIEQNSIPENRIVIVLNYYSKISKKFIQTNFGNVNFISLKYFEFKTGNVHQFQTQLYNRFYNLGKKNLLVLGGKPFKYNRFPAAVQLDQHNLLHDSIITFYKDTIEDTVAYCKEVLNFDNEEKIVEIIEKTSKNVDGVDLNKGHNGHYQGYPYNPALYYQTKLSVILETHFTDERIFVTEKTARAIFNHHPFVVFSSPFFLTELQEQGYKTFNNLTNEYYDCNIIPSARLHHCIQAVKSFCYDVDAIAKITSHNKENLDKIYKEEAQKIINIDDHFIQNN